MEKRDVNVADIINIVHFHFSSLSKCREFKSCTGSQLGHTYIANHCFALLKESFHDSNRQTQQAHGNLNNMRPKAQHYTWVHTNF